MSGGGRMSGGVVVAVVNELDEVLQGHCGKNGMGLRLRLLNFFIVFNL